MIASLRLDGRPGRDMPGRQHLVPMPVIDADADRVEVEASPWPVRAVCLREGRKWTVSVHAPDRLRMFRAVSAGAAILAAVQAVRREALRVGLEHVGRN